MFNQEQYENALDLYRRVLRKNPSCQVDVRVGIGMCQARLKRWVVVTSLTPLL